MFIFFYILITFYAKVVNNFSFHFMHNLQKNIFSNYVLQFFHWAAFLFSNLSLLLSCSFIAASSGGGYRLKAERAGAASIHDCSVEKNTVENWLVEEDAKLLTKQGHTLHTERGTTRRSVFWELRSQTRNARCGRRRGARPRPRRYGPRRRMARAQLHRGAEPTAAAGRARRSELLRRRPFGGQWGRLGDGPCGGFFFFRYSH